MVSTFNFMQRLVLSLGCLNKPPDSLYTSTHDAILTSQKVLYLSSMAQAQCRYDSKVCFCKKVFDMHISMVS